MPRPNARLAVLVLLVLALSFTHAGRARAEWRQPPVAAVLGSDPCGCSRDLRACLVHSTLGLARCLAQVSNPVREAICYLKFELDLVLCVERSAICQLTCIP